MSASPHVTAVERQAKLKRLAAQRFRVADGKVEQYTADFSVQDARDAITAATAAEDAKLQVGKEVGGSIYLGVWEPRDRQGNSLGKTFNVFAARQDLRDTMTYFETVRHIAGLKDWNGFDGTDYASDEEIRAALKDGSYKGGWFIPPRELLAGTEPGGRMGIREGEFIQPDNFYDHQSKGAFKGTFKSTRFSAGYSFSDWYWSSSKDPEVFNYMWNVLFTNGKEVSNNSNSVRLSCRPVRLELKPGAGP